MNRSGAVFIGMGMVECSRATEADAMSVVCPSRGGEQPVTARRMGIIGLR